MSESTAEILAIGSEILAGDVLDTNSHWLCRQLTARGLRVVRITALPDDPDVISEALRAALRRGPSLIITCGGLGPTADDLTLAAVAAALGRPLSKDPAAWEMVRGFYARLYARGKVATPEMTAARGKMAILPEGSVPLANVVGAAPGVLLEEGGTTIACLPGVPAEMKWIFEHSLWPRVAARLAAQVYVERIIPTDCHDESVMAPAVDLVASRHPAVYVKSRAQVYGGEATDFVTLAARAASAAQAAALLDAAEADLRQVLAGVGVHTEPAQESIA